MPPIPPPVQDKILYFAYGANMSPNTLAKRGLGAVQPLAVVQVTQPNIALVFGHRGGYATLTEVEETPDVVNSGSSTLKQKFWRWQRLPRTTTYMASGNRRFDEGSDKNQNFQNSTDRTSISNPASTELIYWEPYGMLYELTPEQLELIQAKEIGYQRKTISVAATITNSSSTETTSRPVTLPIKDSTNETSPTSSLSATVFVSAPWMMLKTPVAPTKRYRDLLLQGATENNLPQPYLHWLEQLPVVVDLSVLGSAEYSDTLAEAALKLIGAAAILVFLSFSFF